MSGRWFRLYDEILDDPKVQKMDPRIFKAWINILCLASRNDGKLPSLEDIAWTLRLSDNDVVTLLERLLNAGLIDKLNGGVNGYHYAPHGWEKRQYKSDSSSERVKRFRQRKKETAPETETETDIPLPKGNGRDASAADVKKAIFDTGKTILTESGRNEREAGSIVGRWRKQYSDAEVLNVLAKCQVEGPSEPVEWISAALSFERNKNGNSKNQNQPDQPSDALLRASIELNESFSDRGPERAELRAIPDARTGNDR